MKAFINILIFCAPLISHSFTEKHVEKLKTLKEITPEDLIHENRGCPENSKCSKQNGIKRAKWLKALNQFKQTNRVTPLNKFILKNGHPTTFLIKEDSSSSLDPIIYSSRCISHKKENIVEASLFLKSKPKSPNLFFNTINTKYGELALPYRSRPLGFKNGKPIVIMEYNDILYTILISSNLKIEVIQLKEEEINLLIEKKSSFKCKKVHTPNLYFEGTDCYSVWDLNMNKSIEVSQTVSCS